MKKFFTSIVVFLFLLIGNGVALPPEEVNARPIPTHEIMEANDPLPTFTEPHLVFHYRRSDNNYTGWKLWLWGQGEGGADYEFTKNEESFGKYLYLPIDSFTDTTQVNFIIKKGSWEAQTPDANIKYADFTFDVATNAYHFYLLNMNTKVFPTLEAALANQILESDFATKTTVKVVTNNEPANYIFKEDDAVVKSAVITASYSSTLYTWSFTINLGASYSPNFTNTYTVEVGYKTGSAVTEVVGLKGIFDDPYFVQELTYEGDDLGVTYSATESVFKAWAPTAQTLKLRIYNSGTPVAINALTGDDTFVEHTFVRGEKGVWSVTLPGNLHGKYYTFVAKHATGEVELTDPYAKAAGINGIRGMIVDFSQTNPTGWDEVNYPELSPTEIIPYELHVADLTADDTWNGTEANRKKFLGLIEEGTTYNEGTTTVKTGFDHIKELGINALQIIPFYDQQNDERTPSFNWGYNPQNYDVLEGSYSSDPYDGLVRIREFKQVVKAYAAEDIRIIMDVVYNHVASLGAHSFNKLVPGYYFRYEANGSPNNASGVGNVTASERVMMENFMRDSTAFWVEEYKIGGFRFDLMGLHTTKSMETLFNKVKSIRNDILVYGEAWDMDQSSRRPTLFHQDNVYKVPGIGAFNDQIRDSFVSNAKSPSAGWVQMPAVDVNSAVTVKNRLKDGMLGKIFGKQGTPTQTINYAAVHDNYTLYDKLTLVGNNKGFDAAQVAKQSLQTDAMVLLSQGVSFIHAGSEMLRSKPTESGFDHNSYQSSYEVNSLKWDEKIDNLSVYDYYRDLINIKRNVPAFQYTTRAEINENVTFTFGGDIDLNDNFIKYTTRDDDFTYTVLFYSVGARLRLNDLDGQTVVLDTSGTLTPGDVVSGTVSLTSNTTIILKTSNEPINPGSSDTSTPPSSGQTSEPTEPSEPMELTWLYITLPIVAVLAAGVALISILQKKRIK
ncbi:MAG: type I pullulanase [Bacilli bacterium]